MNYENMSAAQLLAEKSHMEQVLSMKQAEAIRQANSTLNAEAVEAEEIVASKEIIVYNKKRPNVNIQGRNRWGSREAEKLTVGTWIVVNSFMRGYEFIRVVEKVNTLSETKAFMIVNGKRVKKGTHRITYIG